ncbi:hypothetical protein V8E36_000887 [Tilletia maclaganii]
MTSRSNNPPVSGAGGRALMNRTTGAARRTTTTSSASGGPNMSMSAAANTSTVLGKRAAPSGGDSTATTRRRVGTGSSSLHPSASSSSLHAQYHHGGAGAPSSSSSSNNNTNSSQQESSNANIQVAVRVRGRSSPSAPRPEDSCIITEGPRSNTITISADPLSGSVIGGTTTSLLPFASPIKKSSSSKSKLGAGTAGAEQGKDGAAGTGAKAEEGSRNGAAASNKKTYNFDHVFGPEADQGMVYSDVVAPILKEVLEGYNCTIFAYGQTGTGKTHTMEGDLSPHPSSGTFATDAGIIPRTLFRLFHILETSGSEFSVKASFVELYNEELRDLLAVEDAGADDAPGGASTNTSGNAAGKSSAGTAGRGKDVVSGSSSSGANGATGGMRMYDDAKGRGVVIQGLEEVPITGAEAGLEILRRGSAKRHIAATNCNSQSSRSHSVFSLTIHHTTTNSLSGSQSAAGAGPGNGANKPDTPPPGSKAHSEDVMRIGKLNLVDLAGSENIGRSGAADKRAREAGMINQSLLTLGRVINALVEKQSHIPFRESKLTRLLQESLGGRTKTCIIATVSESKASIDETMSTLEYATRARSIQNRPEMNARTTRTALLSEYIAENLRLRADLKATRSKNGVFLSPETLETMEGNHARAVREAQATKLECDLAQSKIQTMQEQLEQNSAVLARKEEEARGVRMEWERSRAEAARLGAELEASRVAEKEELLLREAYMRSERRVNGVAEGLRGLVQQSTGEVDVLWKKLMRKSSVEETNRELMHQCNLAVYDLVGKLTGQVTDFKKTHERFSNGLADSLVAFVSAQENAKEENLENVGDAFKAVTEALADVREGHTVTYERAQELANQVTKVREEVAALYETRTKQLDGFAKAFFRDVRERQEQFDKGATASLRSLSAQTSQLHEELDRYVAASTSQIDSVRRVAAETVEAERKVLAQERKRIEKSVKSERARAHAAKAAFLQTMQAAADELIGGGLQEYERFASQSTAPLQQRADRLNAFETEHESAVAPLDSDMANLAALKDQATETQNQEIQSISNEVQQWSEALEMRLGTFEKEQLVQYRQRSEADAQDEDRHLEALNKFVSEDAECNKEVLEGPMSAIQQGINDLNDAANTGVASTSTALQQMANSTASQIHSHRKVGVVSLDNTVKNLDKLHTETDDFLRVQVAEEIPSGATPRRHGWAYPTEWTTLPVVRSAAVHQVRQHGPGEDTFGFEYSGSLPAPTTDGEVQNKHATTLRSRSGDAGHQHLPSSQSLVTFPSGAEDTLAASTSVLMTPGRNRRAGRKTSILAEGEQFVMSPFPSVSATLGGKENISTLAAGLLEDEEEDLNMFGTDDSVLGGGFAESPVSVKKKTRPAGGVSGSAAKAKKTRSTMSKTISASSMISSPSASSSRLAAMRQSDHAGAASSSKLARPVRRAAGTGAVATPGGVNATRTPPRSGR